MNKDRRRQLEAVKAGLEKLKELIDPNQLQPPLSEAEGLVEAVRDEEQDAYDNMPESMQNGDRGSDMTAAIDAMESAAQSLQEAASAVDDLFNAIEMVRMFAEEAMWYLDEATASGQ